MSFYVTKIKPFVGSDFKKVHGQALDFYNIIRKRTKRRPYVRSRYFNKDKVFLPLFWNHLFDKPNWRDRVRRLRFFACGIDLIESSTLSPIIQKKSTTRSEIMYRFSGQTKDGLVFYVQIKEEVKTGEKWLVSIFPEK